MHYTAKFKRAFAGVQKLIDTEGEINEAVQLAFRDAMLKLGHEERVRNLYRVKGKLQRDAVFFVPNEPQESYLATRKGRDIILKVRQVGFTTLSCVRAYDMAVWEANTNTGIMAHQENVVKTIFQDIIKFTHGWFKKDWGHLYAPVEKSDSATALVFESDGLGRALNSSIRVLFDFRGKTVHFLHVSEASRIEPDRLLGSLQGVPANGEVIFESTPNGRGGEFYRQWQNHKRMVSLAPYKGHFIPWYTFYPEQAENFPWPEGQELTSYERALLEAHPGVLTKAHLAWRRWCIEANCQGDSEKFDNEYPYDDVTCFTTGENQVFPSSLIRYQDKFVKEPGYVGWLLSDGSKKIEWQDDPKGFHFLWERPKAGEEYVIGCDPSGGVGKDAGCAYVLRRSNGEFVACLWGQLEPGEMESEVWKLANYYNKAWICPEANNHGHVVIEGLKRRHYKNLYKRRQLDQLTQKLSTVVGWLTTNESKLMLTEKFKEAAKTGKVKIRDAGLLDEMSTFLQVASKTGRSIRREAASGSHDDRVIAACLAWEMHEARGTMSDEEETDTAGDYEGGEYDHETGMFQ